MSGRIWLSSLATLAAAALTVYALANPLAFALIVGVAAWFAGVVGGIAAVGAWAEERRGRLAAEAESERLERELVARGPRLRVVPNVSDDEWFGRLYDEKGGHRA